MNIEIVRPGTIKAFEDHLATSERRHGPGYFFVVHFDLRGKVGARPGALEMKKYAFLFFSRPTEEKTKPERVQKIASILQRYHVPFVVLNACESARARVSETWLRCHSSYPALLRPCFSGNSMPVFLSLIVRFQRRQASTSFVEMFARAQRTFRTMESADGLVCSRRIWLRRGFCH